MGTYIKDFETHSAYNTYITGNDKVLPNVSYCEDMDEVHYNPFIPKTTIKAYFNGDDSESTMVMGGSNSYIQYFENIYIDGVKQERVQRFYPLSSGQHEVKYEYTDTITALHTLRGFDGCFYMNAIVIPKEITSLEDYALADCMGLSLTIQSTTPPTLGNNVFSNTNLNNIYVPAESVNAYKAAEGWSTYASLIQAIPA